MEAIDRFLSLGYGYDYGYGSGSGSGSGYGYGSGDGSGYGYGDGVLSFEARKVYMIDAVQTLIESIHGNYARGYILREDLTLEPCFVAKCGDFLAHGSTLKEAVEDARAKYEESLPLETRLDNFVKSHPETDIPYDDLFDWHHILTGSCRMGREEWCKAHGYTPESSLTVREFCKKTCNDYGGVIIRQLAEKYQIKL